MHMASTCGLATNPGIMGIFLGYKANYIDIVTLIYPRLQPLCSIKTIASSVAVACSLQLRIKLAPCKAVGNDGFSCALHDDHERWVSTGEMLKLPALFIS